MGLGTACCRWPLASSSWFLVGLASTLARNNIRAAANVDGCILEVLIVEPASLCYPKLVRIRPERIEEEVQATDPSVENFWDVCAYVLAASLDSSSPVPFGTFMIWSMKGVHHVVPDVAEDIGIVFLHVLFKVARVVTQEQIDLHSRECQNLREQSHHIFVQLVLDVLTCCNDTATLGIKDELPSRCPLR